MIVRNEEAGLTEALQSIRDHVEEIVIIDTGSTDKTPEISKKFADVFQTYTDCNDHEGRMINFAEARNKAASLAKKQWVMWLDGDDLVLGAEHLRDLVNSTRNKIVKTVTSARISMVYELPGGSVNTRERIWSPPAKFEWRGAVHETLCAKDWTQCVHETAPNNIFIRHQPKQEKIREPKRNLRILTHELWRKGYLEPREMFYIAREFKDNGDPVASIRWLNRYVELSRFPEEKSSAYVLLSELYLMRLDYDAAIKSALLAHATCEYLPDPLIQVCKSFYLLGNSGEERQENFRRCIHFARCALDAAKKPHETRLFVNPDRIRVEVHRYLNYALYQLGEVESALESANAGLVWVPEDAQLLQNKKLFLEKLGRTE